MPCRSLKIVVGLLGAESLMAESFQIGNHLDIDNVLSILDNPIDRGRSVCDQTRMLGWSHCLQL